MGITPKKNKDSGVEQDGCSIISESARQEEVRWSNAYPRLILGLIYTNLAPMTLSTVLHNFVAYYVTSYTKTFH